MAEIGVVMLLFTIGIEFSLNHLLKIRKIVFLGGFLQLLFTVVVTLLIARGYDIDWTGALFIGFLTALSSTAVVLKILQERSELTSNYGRTVLGHLDLPGPVAGPPSFDYAYYGRTNRIGLASAGYFAY